MPLAQSVRSVIPLVVGLVVGGVGAVLFQESMPGAEGSPQERASKLEADLKQAQNRITALEAGDAPVRNKRGLLERATGGSGRGRTLADGARAIAEDIRAGRPVSPEDLFRATQPLARDLSPLFDRIRVKSQKQMIDTLTGEFARKYNLTPQNQAALKVWFEQKSNEEAKRWTELVGQEGTRLEDVIRATVHVRPDEGIETFMQGVLPTDKFAAFKSERLADRAQSVQHEADRKVQRLTSIVPLDDAQRDQVFGIMARGSRDYDPSMVLDGIHGEIGATPSGDRQAAMLSVLRPDQRAVYEAERQRRRDEASKEMESVGLALPPNWEMLDDIDF